MGGGGGVRDGDGGGGASSDAAASMDQYLVHLSLGLLLSKLITFITPPGPHTTCLSVSESLPGPRAISSAAREGKRK